MRNNAKSLPSISVGIACLNEQGTIKQLLQSILLQKETNFILKDITILSDGSTDETVKKSKEVQDSRIHVLEGGKRLGKATRLNELSKRMNGDIFIFLDADITITRHDIFSSLIKTFLTHKNIGLAGGNPHPFPGKTFIERAVNLTYNAYAPLRTLIRNGSNPHGCDGKILALTKKFAQTVSIPPTMIGVDSFLYFMCITRGLSFQHVPEAIVFYRSPSTFQDQIKQNTRFIGAEYIHRQYFGELVKKEYYVPPMLFYTLLAKNFIQHPISSTAIFFINKYCAYKAKENYNKFHSLWDMVTTTKGSHL